jgi:hypothetical protein
VSNDCGEDSDLTVGKICQVGHQQYHNPNVPFPVAAGTSTGYHISLKELLELKKELLSFVIGTRILEQLLLTSFLSEVLRFPSNLAVY